MTLFNVVSSSLSALYARRSLSAIVFYSTLASGCINFIDGEDPPEEPQYTDAKIALAHCLVESDAVRGYGDGGEKDQEQRDLFGEEAWKIMEEIHTPCFAPNSYYLLPECSNFDPNTTKALFPVWTMLTGHGSVGLSGVLSLESFAALTKDFECTYTPEQSPDL